LDELEARGLIELFLRYSHARRIIGRCPLRGMIFLDCRKLLRRE
jgi:hypothetical protein